MICLTQDKLKAHHIFVYMNTNLIFDMRKPTDLPLLNAVLNMATLLILVQLKSFASQTLLFELDFLEAFNFHKIIIMLLNVISPSVLCQIVGKLTLNLISPYYSSSFKFYKYLYFYFPIGQFLYFFAIL